MTEFDETKPLSAAMEGLQALKYESDSNDGRNIIPFIFGVENSVFKNGIS